MLDLLEHENLLGFEQQLLNCSVGWSGGAMVLGKLPVPEHPTNLDFSRARVCCA